MDVHELIALRDGSRVLIRPVRRADRERFEDGFTRLTPKSRYRRLLGFKKRLTEEELAVFTHVDRPGHEALGALDPASGEGVAVARSVRLGDSDAAEVSVVVVDAWQGRGVGGALLERLAFLARAAGIRRFVATPLPESRAMLHVFECLGPVELRSGGRTLELEVELDESRRAATAVPAGPRARA
jgi:GNAT superfamily N-acetyltransferase